MATDLKSLKATTSVMKEGFTFELQEKELHLTSFAGGEERGGKCLQLTMQDDLVQMTKPEVQELVQELVKWLAS